MGPQRGIVLLLWGLVCSVEVQDPDDIFAPSFNRPRLQIVRPENGQVLETSVLAIELKVQGYDLPSLLRDSKVCIGLASGDKRVQESCFEQTKSMVFHANGLAPGATYMLRAVLFDRSNAVAVSVRSFRVGTIDVTPLDNDRTTKELSARSEIEAQHVTIQTALQIALARHERGDRRHAEHIYRQIILERPSHADALHLLGVALYQNGDAVSAIPYIERAMDAGLENVQAAQAVAAGAVAAQSAAGNRAEMEQMATQKTNSSKAMYSFDNFHNSLGECFRVLGRTQQAVAQYERALQLRPDFPEAHFNMGIALQELRRWERAVHHFRQVNGQSSASKDAPPRAAGNDSIEEDGSIVDTELTSAQRPPAVSAAVAYEARVRECDLLAGLGRSVEALECLRHAMRRWPLDGHFANELGNTLLLMSQGMGQGPVVNEGGGGNSTDGVEAVQQDGESTGNSSIDTQHTPLAQMTATSLLEDALIAYKRAAELGFGAAALMNMALVREINGEAKIAIALYEKALSLSRERGSPSRHIAIKLATVLPRVMPAAQDLAQTRAQFEHNLDALLATEALGKSEAGSERETDHSEPLNKAFSIGYHLAFHGAGDLSLKTKLHRVLLRFCPPLSTGRFLREDNIMMRSHVALRHAHAHDARPPRFAAEVDAALYPATASATTAAAGIGTRATSSNGQRKIRVGIVSRFLNDHEVGQLMLGVVQQLARPGSNHEILLFPIAAGERDETGDALRRAVGDRHVVDLPDSLSHCHEILHAARLDVVLYPELGLDPVAYFLAFARFAPAQAVWWYHPSTSGLPAIDYFVSTEHEVRGAESQYSERLFRMAGGSLGFYYARPMLRPGSPLRSETRAALAEKLSLPRKYRLYLIATANALLKLHPKFDEAIAEILSSDPAGQLVVLTSRDRAPWAGLVLRRLASQPKVKALGSSLLRRVHWLDLNGDSTDRRRTEPVAATQQQVLELLQAADVVLDTFPAGGSHVVLRAFAMGVPVVTLEGQLLSGRIALTMYRRMGLGNIECIAHSVREYAHVALRLAHSARFRRDVSARIAAASHKLFDDAVAVSEWRRFFDLTHEVAQAQLHERVQPGSRVGADVPPEVSNGARFAQARVAPSDADTVISMPREQQIRANSP